MQVKGECEDFEVRFCCQNDDIVQISTLHTESPLSTESPHLAESPFTTESVTSLPQNLTASILTTLPKNIDQLRKLNSSLRQKFVLLLMPSQSIPSKVSRSAFQVILDCNANLAMLMIVI